VELFLDGRRREEFANPGYGPGVAQALISPPEAAGRCEVHVVRGVLQGVEAVGKRTPYGYTVEARVPLTRGAFPELRLQPGSLLGFDVALDDADDGGERKAQLVWQGSAMNCSDTSLFGRLRL
jgi:hypothetical protein